MQFCGIDSIQKLILDPTVKTPDYQRGFSEKSVWNSSPKKNVTWSELVCIHAMHSIEDYDRTIDMDAITKNIMTMRVLRALRKSGNKVADNPDFFTELLQSFGILQ